MSIKTAIKSIFQMNKQADEKSKLDLTAMKYLHTMEVLGNSIKFPKSGDDEEELSEVYSQVSALCDKLYNTQFGASHWTVELQSDKLIIPPKTEDEMVNALNRIREIITNALHRHDVSLGASVEDHPMYQSMSYEYMMLIKIALYLKHAGVYHHENKVYGDIPMSYMDFLHDVTPFNMMGGLYAVSKIIHYEGIVPMERAHNIALNAVAYKPGTVVTRYTLGALNALLMRTTGLHINKPSALGVYGETILTPYMTSEEINDWHDSMLDLERWMSIHQVNSAQWLHGRKQVVSDNGNITVPFTDTFVTSRVLTSGIWFCLRKDTPYLDLYPCSD